MLLRQHDSALQSLGRAVEVNPSFGQGYYYLGLAQVFCGLTDEARSSADAAMRLTPQDPMAPFMADLYGLAYMLDRDFDAALSHFSKAVERNRKDPIINRNVANVLGHLGRFDEAREYLQVFERQVQDISPGVLRRSMPFKYDEHFDIFTGGISLVMKSSRPIRHRLLRLSSDRFSHHSSCSPREAASWNIPTFKGPMRY